MSLLADVWRLSVLQLLLVFTSHGKVKAVSCYECNSFLESDCTSGKLDKFKVTCDESAVACRKIQYKFDFRGHGKVEYRIVRQCAKTTKSLSCISIFGTNGKRYKQITCECKEDGCNASQQVKSAKLFTWIVFVVIINVFV